MGNAIDPIATASRSYAGGLIRYDAHRRRIWVGPQRLHHGTTGALMVAGGFTGLAARWLSARGGVRIALLGSALMAHDWGDRARWFEAGGQEE